MIEQLQNILKAEEGNRYQVVVHDTDQPDDTLHYFPSVALEPTVVRAPEMAEDHPLRMALKASGFISGEHYATLSLVKTEETDDGTLRVIGEYYSEDGEAVQQRDTQQAIWDITDLTH